MLGAYYFRVGMFTLVPEQIRVDLDWMRAIGTDAVCLAVNVNDLDCNRLNLDFLVEAIHGAGMQVFFVPSRIAGITAGAPLTPSLLGYLHPDSWSLDRDGAPYMRRVGPVCSFYHPAVADWFVEQVGIMIRDWPVDGIIWDEPKSTYWQDFAPRALDQNPTGDFRHYMRDFAAFFGGVNLRLRTLRPDLTLIHFDEACRNDIVVEESARIAGLDYFGADGRPWVCADPSRARSTKVLPDYGERFLRAARAEGKHTFALLENQRLTVEETAWMERDLPRVLALDIDYLAYYYYRAEAATAARNMELMRTHLAPWRQGH